MKPLNYISSGVSYFKNNLRPYLLATMIGLGVGCGSGEVIILPNSDNPEGDNKVAAVTITPAKVPYKECVFKYEQAKSGQVSRKDYLDDRFNCVPEVVDARNDGTLKGFLNNPTNEELEVLITDLLSQIIPDEKKLREAVMLSIHIYNSPAQDVSGKKVITYARIIPPITDIVGQGVPIYIDWNDNIFTNPNIKNDSDIESLIRHEVEAHSYDVVNGFELDGKLIDSSMLATGQIDNDFFQELLELRAEHLELKKLILEYAETGEYSINFLLVRDRFIFYNDHWSYLVGNTRNKTERKLRDAQFKQFVGIVPHVFGNRLMMMYNLDGEKGILVLQLEK